MAASISQQPSEYNKVVGPNTWVVTGIGSADAYAIGIEVDGTLVATFQQPANPAGVAIFDASKVLQSYLSPEFQTPQKLTTTPYNPFEELPYGTNANENANDTNGGTLFIRYRLRFGTVTSNVITWDGYSSSKYVINAYKPQYELDWDPTATFHKPSLTLEACASNPGDMGVTDKNWKYLTDFPYYDNNETNPALTGAAQRIASNEYATLSWFHEFDNEADLDYNNFAAYLITFDYYNAAGTLIEQHAIPLTESAAYISPRSDCNDLGPFTFATNEQIAQFGVGPQNLKDADALGNYAVDLWISAPNEPNLDHYYVRIWTFNSCLYVDNSNPTLDCEDIGELLDYANSKVYEMRYDYVSYDCQKFEPLRISWINSFGTHDYYTFYKRNTETDSITRNNYYQLPGTWSDSSFSVNPYDRGSRTFSTQITTDWTAQSDYMSELEGEYLKSLFWSPSANFYWDGEWRSIEITSASYEHQTFGRDKMFRYTINFRLAVNPRVQRG